MVFSWCNGTWFLDLMIQEQWSPLTTAFRLKMEFGTCLGVWLSLEFARQLYMEGLLHFQHVLERVIKLTHSSSNRFFDHSQGSSPPDDPMVRVKHRRFKGSEAWSKFKFNMLFIDRWIMNKCNMNVLDSLSFNKIYFEIRPLSSYWFRAQRNTRCPTPKASFWRMQSIPFSKALSDCWNKLVPQTPKLKRRDP